MTKRSNNKRPNLTPLRAALAQLRVTRFERRIISVGRSMAITFAAMGAI